MNKMDKIFPTHKIDCVRLGEWLEERFSNYEVKTADNFSCLQSMVVEKTQEDWIHFLTTENLDEVSLCLKEFILDKSKKYLNKARKYTK